MRAVFKVFFRVAGSFPGLPREHRVTRQLRLGAPEWVWAMVPDHAKDALRHFGEPAAPEPA
jgi:hypothetical protein